MLLRRHRLPSDSTPLRSGLLRLGVVLALVTGTAAAASIGDEEVTTTPAVVAGEVLGGDGESLAGATVEWVEGGVIETSGADGRFELGATLPATLLVSHAGHLPATLSLTEETAAVRVELEPLSSVSEIILVQASEVGGSFSPNSIASAIVDPLEVTVTPTSLKETVVGVAGVAENGQGGLFQSFSVRGVSRQRLLTLLAGARLTSERRAGVAASFVDPLLLGEVEVLRGPASTYYGSGALGGAIQLLPRRFERLDVATGYHSQGDEAYLRVGWGSRDWSAGLAHRDAGDAETATGERLFSRFEQTSATLRRRFELSPRRSGELMVVGSYGDDIGKANLEFPGRTTIYPEERHLFARFSVDNADRWRAWAYLHPHDLLTEATEPLDSGQRALVDNETFDLGATFEHELPFGERLGRRVDGRLGLDYFGRRGVTALEQTFAPSGDRVLEEATLDGAERDELALVSVLNWAVGRLRLEVGGRLTRVEESNDNLLDAGDRPDSYSADAATGFLGAAFEATQSLRLVANVGTGLRFPSLTELFFTGTTGRGLVIGNPDLREESALDADLSVRWFGRRGYLGLTAFRNDVEDYIERVAVSESVGTFVNLGSGVIEGFELDGFRRFALEEAPFELRLDWSAHRIRGRADDGSALADVPADRLRTGLAVRNDAWGGRTSVEYRAAHDRPGPSERAIPEAVIVDASVERRLASQWKVSLELRNLLDEDYFPSADDQAPMAAGRSIGLGLRWSAD